MPRRWPLPRPFPRPPRRWRSSGSSPPTSAQRDLFLGPWGAEHAPDPAATYVFEEKKKQGMLGGFSPGYTVRGPGGIEWSAKQGPEAQAEVTASRLVWALGFHQPPVYFLENWNALRRHEPGEADPRAVSSGDRGVSTRSESGAG